MENQSEFDFWHALNKDYKNRSLSGANFLRSIKPHWQQNVENFSSFIEMTVT